jgi:SSS family solute:Na+ symporter
MAAWQIGVLVLVIYLGIIMYMGYRSYRVGTGTFVDDAVASRSLGIVVLTFTFAATFHSAYAFTGIVGFAATHGMPFWINGLWLVPPALLFWEFGKRLWVLGKKYNYVTLAEYLGDAYESRTLAIVVAAVQTLFTVPYITVQLMGSGYLFNTLTEGRIPFEYGAAIMLLVMVAYVWVGGIRAVAWTDTVQGIMMFVTVVAGSYYVVTQLAGSITGLFAQAAEQIPAAFSLPGTAGFYSGATWVSMWVPLTLGILLAPHIVMRAFAARSLNVLKWASVGGAVYITFIYIFTPALGMAGALFRGDTPPDQFFIHQLWTHLPVGLAALALAGGFAASMSTADSQIHAVSTTIASDFYRAFVKKKATDKDLQRVMHIVHVVVGLAAFYWVVTKPSLLVNVVTIAVGGTALLAPVLVGALYSQRVKAEVAIAGIVLGLAVLITTQFIYKNPFGLGILPGMWGLLVATVITLVGALLSPSVKSGKVVEQQEYIETTLSA